MNIKEDKQTAKKIIEMIKSFLFGANEEEKEARMPMYTATFGVMIVSLVVGCIFFLLTNNAIFVEYMIASLIIGSIIGIGLTLVSLIASAEFNKNYGWGVWFRSIIINLLIFSVAMLVNKSYDNEKTTAYEYVTAYSLVKTDVKNCHFRVDMESKNLTYSTCSNSSKFYESLNNGETQIRLLISEKYGVKTVTNYEIISNVVKIKKG